MRPVGESGLGRLKEQVETEHHEISTDDGDEGGLDTADCQEDAEQQFPYVPQRHFERNVTVLSQN